MIVGIDASRYRTETPTGVEWYSYHLLNALIPILGRDHDLEVRLYTRGKEEFKTDFPFNVKQKEIKGTRFWTIFRLSLEMILNPIDLLFIPSHILPLFIPRKVVVTIHDIAFKIPELKQSYDLKNSLLLRFSTWRSVRKAHKIIVPSEATKNDLIKYYNCKKDKIVVIPHGSPDYSGDNNPALKTWSQKEKETMLKRLNLKESDLTMLYIGRIEFKKNIIKLLQGFARFLMEYPDWKLVLAGKEGIGIEEIKQEMENLNLAKNVVLTGYISEEEKMFLLDKCRVFVIPSKYEGFGLPILEAFKYRRPVLTSKVSSMPEIAGDAAFLVNPDSEIEIGVGMKRLVADGMYISKLINNGEERLKLYNWEKSAEKTFDTLIYS